MIEEKSFKEHLRTIAPDQWKKLFKLIPKIEKAKVFGKGGGFKIQKDGTIEISSSTPTKIVSDFLHVFYEIELCVVFDWSGWEKGRKILTQQDFDYNQLSTFELCKLLTTIVRADRFNDGVLIAAFENGNILNIIKAIEQNESGAKKKKRE